MQANIVKTGETARAIVAEGRGILAADETVPTLSKRLAAKGIESTSDNRRAFRELFFTTPGVERFVGGVILQDETIRQNSSLQTPLAGVLIERGIIPGIKVDDGAHPMAGAPGELITEGLDRLRQRLGEYRKLGARFCKWRAVLSIGEGRPSLRCIHANAHALARYAALCQEQALTPIVEPEVLTDGAHSVARCEEVTGLVLRSVFNALVEQRVYPEGILLKPNMITAGRDAHQQASVSEVAEATLRVLRRNVPAAVPAIVFLSGGQRPVLASQHLDAINELPGNKPWVLSYSYGRALQDEALEAWRGREENRVAAQHAFYHRARCDSAAALGRYRPELEAETEPDFAQA